MSERRDPEAPRVTIVMTARERHSLAPDAIRSICDRTEPPFRFVYADSGSPDWLRETFKREAEGWGMEIVRFDDGLWPNQIRKRISETIGTDYVVFLDNDVAVEEGWLEALVACADETGAGIVAPLYLVGGAGAAPKIHMAGGKLEWHSGPDGVALDEHHRFVDTFLADVAPQLKREPCDFAEYHCVLMRSNLAKDGSVFDETIVCVHEHIDAALTAKKLGHTVYFEPRSHVSYQAFEPVRLGDIAFFRTRWSDEAANSSIAAFSAKWVITDEARSFGGIRKFLQQHRSRVDPLRRAVPDAIAQAPMTAPMLTQTLAGLFALGLERSYTEEEWSLIENAYRLAMTLMNGLYRPCGRPFVNHLAGTASVLMHYELKAQIVAAGLLHAAYTHRPDLAKPNAGGGSELGQLLGGRSPLNRRVRDYAQRARHWQRLRERDTRPEQLTIEEGETLIVAAANEIDMHLSGEFLYSGRRDFEDPEILGLMTCVCETVGVPGLTATLRREREALERSPIRRKSASQESFRIAGNRLVPVGSGASGPDPLRRG